MLKAYGMKAKMLWKFAMGFANPELTNHAIMVAFDPNE